MSDLIRREDVITVLCFCEETKMMFCKDLRKILEKIDAISSAEPERKSKVIEHDASITDTDGYKYLRTEYLCGNCKKRVIGGDEYCSHCGAKLDWSGNE